MQTLRCRLILQMDSTAVQLLQFHYLRIFIHYTLQVAINMTSLVKAGQHPINVISLDGNIVRYAEIIFLVEDMNNSNGKHFAIYNPILGAPMCFVKSKQCSSGKLLRGRGDVGPKNHAPNTLDDFMDGSSGKSQL